MTKIKFFLIIFISVGIVVLLIPQIELLFARQKTHQIKVGMTRAELRKYVEHDGGFVSYYEGDRNIVKGVACHDYETFYLTFSSGAGIKHLLKNRSFYRKAIKINVSFDPVKGSTWGDPQDKIKSISAPYCEYSVSD